MLASPTVGSVVTDVSGDDVAVSGHGVVEVVDVVVDEAAADEVGGVEVVDEVVVDEVVGFGHTVDVVVDGAVDDGVGDELVVDGPPEAAAAPPGVREWVAVCARP